MKTMPRLLLLILVALFLSACEGDVNITPTEGVSISEAYTAAAMTLTAQASLVTSTITSSPAVTSTTQASPTNIPNTPTAQNINYTYSTANGCNNATFVSDATIPDGTVMTPGEILVKTWKFQNSGGCDWDAYYLLTFETGTDMEGGDTTLDEAVAVGETESISVTLVAPETEGTYTGYWRLSTDSGETFGQSVFVLIVVSEDVATLTPTPADTTTPTVVPTTEEIGVTDTPTPTPVPADTPTFTPLPTEEAVEPDEQAIFTPEPET